MHQEFISWLLIIAILVLIIGAICQIVVYFILNIIIDSLIMGFGQKIDNTATGLKKVASDLNRIGFRKKTRSKQL